MNTSDVGSSTLGRVLNLVGIVAVGWAIIDQAMRGLPAWILAAGLVSLALWLVIVITPRDRGGLTLALLVAVALLAGIGTVATNGVLLVPVAVAVMRTMSRPERPFWQGVSLGLLSAATIAVGALIDPLPALGLLSIEGGLAIAFLGGLSRRQFRVAEAQSRALLEERVAIHEEQARAAVLAERQAVARDIHDVLAHSLGGLVVQLDAVEALLEAGRVEDAATRARDARALAASGLTEARRAVQALRDEPAAALDFTTALDDLVRAHRTLGGDVEVDEHGSRRELPAAESTALARLLQESLTNARKHAPGVPVRVAVDWERGSVRLEVENPAGTASELAATGGGNGIRGMAERFAALPGASFSAGERAGRFVVDGRVSA
jgi:signal transduction histidine kinase